MRNSAVSTKAHIREMEASELEEVIKNTPVTESETILLAMKQYEQVTGKEYEM